MTKFIWKAKDRFGNPVIMENEASTAEESKTILLAEGCTELSLIQDEVGAAAIAGMGDTITMFGEEVKITAEERLKHRGRPAATFWSVLWRGIVQSKSLLLTILVIAGFEIYTGRNGPLIYHGIKLLGWLTFVICMGLPSIYYGRLHKAADWYSWPEVLEIVGTLEKINKYHLIKVPASDLGRFRAGALAGMGRLSEALDGYSRYENQTGCPSWLYKAFVASTYDKANQHAAAVEWNLKSIEEKPAPTMYLDLANRYARYIKDPVKARAALAEAEKGPLSETAIPFLKRCRGIVAYLEQNWASARQELEASLKIMERTPHVPFRAGHISVAKAYLCCVLARQGEQAAAKKNLADARKYLVATGEDELLAECERLTA